MSEQIKDVTDDDFAVQVLARSRQIPVVVDLWAPWCGPCRQLAPILEKVAAARAGEFELVKLNVDENPKVAAQLGARSIPLVVGFRDGQVAAHFVGAQPESAIRQFIDQLVPSEADRLVSEAESERDAGREVAAERLLQQAIELDKHHEGARMTLARLLGDADRIDEALEVLAAVASTGHDEAAALQAELQLKQSGNVDTEALRARVAADPDDLDAAIALGRALGASGQHQQALDLLLGAVGKDASYEDGAAKRAVLDIFSVLGGQNPLTREYRQKLARMLF
ncbi:MAG: thioredoxin [Proteobacteria bacterium]|jgi:putative thioredoxin|nr:thioredoxin [Pseudomonadota bacterium]